MPTAEQEPGEIQTNQAKPDTPDRQNLTQIKAGRDRLDKQNLRDAEEQ